METSQQAKSVAIIGLGYVGLPLALLSAKKGYNTVGIDLNKQKVDLINDRKSPFIDARVSEELENTTLKATTDISEVKNSDIIIICVPTPVYENRLPNYEPVESACKAITPYLKKGDLVILESTVNPGVCEEIMLPLLEENSGLKAGTDFSLAHCPERINPGDKKWNVTNIPRVVGGLDKLSLDLAVTFYQSIISAEIKPMGSLKEAEAVKVVENSFRNVNIAFVNELAVSFARLDIDVVNVIDGAATKPFSFMPHYPGCGIGGHCIPVDPYYLIDYAKSNNGFEHKFLGLACKTNEDMPKYTVELLEDGLDSMEIFKKNAKVALLGLSYKKDIDDCRESPSFEIAKVLEKKGIKYCVFDPYVPNKSTVATLEDALKRSNAVILATDHSEFKKLTGSDFAKYGIKVVIDGRNCLDKADIEENGIYYSGIGR